MLLTYIYSPVLFVNVTAGILKPTVAGSNQSSYQLPEKLVSDDLDSSLANLVGSKCQLFRSCIIFVCQNMMLKGRYYTLLGAISQRMHFCMYKRDIQASYVKKTQGLDQVDAAKNASIIVSDVYLVHVYMEKQWKSNMFSCEWPLIFKLC